MGRKFLTNLKAWSNEKTIIAVTGGVLVVGGYSFIYFHLTYKIKKAICLFQSIRRRTKIIKGNSIEEYWSYLEY